ncbi:uncharacterized protein N7446_008781 [Penicillium canescens]|uniref:NmrA-like domain-containing protein n=1 Tax=Penicillium canescens TaxID=5083 RepID=A0AAD6ISE0_PENCN|nr:uncharacterized protein N7446_008781 [Penicillium canescens]KAJ6032926.1 hypothetical protein N7444_010697 [Penicillium canescens]KAJ6057884.1 hypothetical protein N7460_001158 [Penicillium canescens]KAJ6059198.1 hypothetical protein N7446_008781 [Penicillium canescens]
MALFKNVLLIGAGGNLGVPVLKAFLASPYKVGILTRKESTSTFPKCVPVFKADYTDVSSIKLAMESQDVVISMVGGIAAGDQQVFIDAALAAGVKRFLPSEFGPYSRNPEFAALNPPLISWSSLVTGAFFDWAMKVGFFGFDLASKTVTLIDGGTSKDILDVVEKVDGQKWTVRHVTSEEVIYNGKRRLAAGDFAGIMDLTRGGAFGKRALGDESSHGFWNDELGLPKEDIEQTIRNML